MSEEKIQTYCRLRPVEVDAVNYEIGVDEDEDTEYEKVDFYTPKHHVNPFDAVEDEKNAFRFNKIFDQSVGQIDVFEMVAKEILDHVLGGYNGTIFAYGQTGTGKTHTIVGKDKTPKGVIEENSGIIPRSLQYIFSVIEEMGMDAKVSLSYMEIYKGVGYDLMSGTRSKKGENRNTPSNFNELQIVVGRMGPRKKLSLVNLGVTEVTSLKEAMKMFVAGSKNRQMAETGINDASSRSHCVFTVEIHTKTVSHGRVVRPKINFVDLAGSERVGKHHEMSRALLAEARTINLSLHHLQEVIVALGKSQKQRHAERRIHVPYRNTMITSVLRESLGGNCKTSMIATVTPDSDNYNETLSTCKFSQRVAQIENLARVQHEVDFKVLASQLKEENQTLRDKLATVSENTALFNSIVPLDDLEKDHLRDIVGEYLDDHDSSAAIMIENDNRKIQFCFKLLKYGLIFDKEPRQAQKEMPTKHPKKKKKSKNEIAAEEHAATALKKEEVKKAHLQKINQRTDTLDDKETTANNNEIIIESKQNGLVASENEAMHKGKKKKKDIRLEDHRPTENTAAISSPTEQPKAEIQHGDETLQNGDVPAPNEPVPSKKEQARINREKKKNLALEKKQEKMKLKEERAANKAKNKKVKKGAAVEENTNVLEDAGNENLTGNTTADGSKNIPKDETTNDAEETANATHHPPKNDKNKKGKKKK